MTKFKYLVVILFSFSFGKIYALDKIEINNENLIPIFNKNTYIYNYYTNKDTIKIEVSKNKDEIVKGYGIFELKDNLNEFEIESTINNEIKTYHINVYKNYIKEDENIATFKYFNVIGYDINFKNDIHEYTLDINKDAYLEFDYELDNYDSIVNIENNGNFSNGINDVEITISSKNEINKNTYIIHVNKTIEVFKEEEKVNEELSFSQKQILIIFIVTLCSILTVFIFYLIFVRKIF